MKAIVALFVLLLSACSAQKQHHPDIVTADHLFDGFTDEEKTTPPQGAILPDEAGVLFIYHTLRNHDLTDRQAEFLLFVVGAVARETLPPSLANKMIIVGFPGKTSDLILTADFENNELEVWRGSNTADHYVKKTYKGDVNQILSYLKDGVDGSPVVEEGKRSEELQLLRNKRTTL